MPWHARVGLIGCPGILTNSSSPNVARKRANAALMPGWPKPIRCPARVTLRSTISASKARKRFKSPTQDSWTSTITEIDTRY
jgi:hypothetical protein